MLTIGELARTTGANVSTIRHYERVGLLAAPSRSDGNQRRYSESDRARLSFITHSRDLGLSIQAIRDMLRLSEQRRLPGTEIARIADEQLKMVRGKITKLARLERELARISKLGTLDGGLDCRVMEVLDGAPSEVASG